MMTYGQVLETLRQSTKPLYVAVIYAKGTHEWLPVDKTEYIRQLGLIHPDSLSLPYPCYFEIESDGEMFIHPRTENR
jgi:hypothetical protein